MNKRAKNLIVYLVFFAVLLISMFSSLFSKANLWRPENNKSVDFNGIYFDIPTNISNLKISRSINDKGVRDKIIYDVEFAYAGSDSNMRIIGQVCEQIFFKDGVNPSHSNVTLKGEYDSINDSLFDEKLVLREYYKEVPEYKFASKSQIRVPLTEAINTYKFRLVYEPRELIYSKDTKIGELAVFLTNARIDKFTDNKYDSKTETHSYVESGINIKALEVYDEAKLQKIANINKLNNALFVISVIGAIIIIALNKTNNLMFLTAAMSVTVLTFYRFMQRGIAPKATFTAIPIIAFITYILIKIITKEKLKFKKTDFTQALVYSIVMMLISVMVFALPIAMS
ncbi:MAG: hypothetical protein Q4P29_03045 [Tissierellia bacterium]|nr:hypothetical protein [Tissierellia bacterium]